MALVVASVVPVVAMVVISAIGQRSDARELAASEAARVGRLAALREADLVEGGRNVLAAIAQTGPARFREGDACSKRLAELLPVYPRFANFGVVDTTGYLFCSAIPPTEPLNFGDRPWFTRVTATGEFAVGDYQRGRITGKPSLVFGGPVRGGNGALAGVAWAALDLSWLQQFAQEVKLPGKPAVAVLDRHGTVLARDPDPDRWVGRTVRDLPELVRRAGSGAVETAGFDGVKRLYTFTPLGDPANPHAIVSVGIATSAAYRDSNRALRTNLLLLAVLTAVGMAAARLAAQRFIVAPTRSLVAAARRLAGGNLAARVGPSYGPGELGAVGSAFDEMASALECRQKALAEAVAVQRKSEARFRSLLESAPDGVVGVDAGGAIRLLNRRAEALFGWPRNDLIGRHVETLCPEARRQFDFRADREISAACLERYGTVAVTAVRHDGSCFPAEVTLAALDTDEGQLVSIGVRDVTDRRQSEEALARSAQQLQAIVDNAPALIWMQDTGGRYVVVNRQFELVNKVTGDEARGRTAADVFEGHLGEELHARDMEPLVRGMAVEGEEVLFLDDGPHWYISLRFPLHDASGDPYAVCGILTDVTERIHAETQREALAAQLQQSQRLESLGQLAGGVAHDFNNLLAVIINYADFVLDALPDPAPRELKDVFDGIRSDTEAIFRAAETAAALTRQLLIFGRRDAAHARVLDIEDVIRNVEPLLRRTLGEDVELVLCFGSGVPNVHADAGRLEQVLLNLAVNARDAMPVGGRLIVATGNLEISEEAAAGIPVPPGAWVTLTVSDTGVGMTPSVAARAFEPFFTTKPKGHGTGLGLATVFGVVREAGGEVAIESAPGEGTTIRVYLPAVAGEARVANEAGGPLAPAGTGQSILVVEDEAVMREVTRRILAGHGYSVVSAVDATEAIRICEDKGIAIDLILSDVVMPGLSGPELVERARTLRPGVPAIYMSGYPEDFVARRHAAEDVTVVRKPFTPGILLRHVRAALDH